RAGTQGTRARPAAWSPAPGLRRKRSPASSVEPHAAGPPDAAWRRFQILPAAWALRFILPLPLVALLLQFVQVRQHVMAVLFHVRIRLEIDLPDHALRIDREGVRRPHRTR